jgi:hypothetical protein
VKKIFLATVLALVLVSPASVSVASAAAGSTFTGSATTSPPPAGFPNTLTVSFTELGVGSTPVNYSLNATAEFLLTDGCHGSWVERKLASSATENPIVPQRGRASGTLAASAAWPAGLPGCPPVFNEDGTIQPMTPGQVTFLGWADITVTSSTGRVLQLPDIVTTP